MHGPNNCVRQSLKNDSIQGLAISLPLRGGFRLFSQEKDRHKSKPRVHDQGESERGPEIQIHNHCREINLMAVSSERSVPQSGTSAAIANSRSSLLLCLPIIIPLTVSNTPTN